MADYQAGDDAERKNCEHLIFLFVYALIIGYKSRSVNRLLKIVYLGNW